MQETVDVAVVGAGPVGSLAALALAGQGRSVALIEARPPAPPRQDGRVFALSLGSMALLEVLGVSARLPQPPAPIARVRVSAEGVFGALRFDAGDLRRPALGAAVAAEALEAALAASLASSSVHSFRPFALEALERGGGDSLRLVLAGGEGALSLRARLVVGADGVDSTVRRLAGIDYEHCGPPDRLLLASLTGERKTADTAHLRFTSDGAVALVPTGRERFAAVLALGEGGGIPAEGRALADAFQARIGWRLGGLRPLAPPRIHRVAPARASRLIGERVVLLGPAALSLHPVAAQGLNLALRDLAWLAERLAGADDPGAAELLAAHEEARRSDHQATLHLVEGLRRWFAAAPRERASAIDAVGFLLLDRIAPLREKLLRWVSGLHPPVPALLRGAIPR